MTHVMDRAHRYSSDGEALGSAADPSLELYAFGDDLVRPLEGPRVDQPGGERGASLEHEATKHPVMRLKPRPSRVVQRFRRTADEPHGSRHIQGGRDSCLLGAARDVGHLL